MYGEINSARTFRTTMALKSIASTFFIITEWKVKNLKISTYFIESVWSSVNPPGQVFFQMLKICVALLKQPRANFLEVVL